MYCSNCGRQLEAEARYCSVCGTERGTMRPAPSEQPDVKKLSRPREGKMIAGVCAGVARYFELDVTLVRILWILVSICPAVPGIVAYVVCWAVMPRDPESVSPSAPVPHVVKV